MRPRFWRSLGHGLISNLFRQCETCGGSALANCLRIGVASGCDCEFRRAKDSADFQRGFIRAETIAYADYLTCKGENGAKEAGKLRIEGSDYKVVDGDVFHFRFNV